MTPDIIEEKIAELQTLEGNDYQTDYYPVSIEWLEQTLTTIHQQGVLSERERATSIIENITVESANPQYAVNANVLDFAGNLLGEFKKKAIEALTPLT